MRIVLVAMAALAAVTMHAQEPVYRWAEDATNEHPERRIERLLDLADRGFVLLRMTEDATTVRHYWLEQFDKDLRSQGTHEVLFNNGVMGDAFFLEDVLAVNGRLLAVVTHWNKAEGRHRLLLQPLAFDGVLGPATELASIAAEKMGNRGTFRWSVSPGGGKLIVLEEAPFTKGAMERVGVKCFTFPALTLDWEHKQELEWPSDKAVHNAVQVDDQGRAYLFKRTWQKPAWEYAMYSTGGAGDWKVHQPSGLAGKQLESQRFSVGPDGHAYVYALYTTEPSNVNKKVHGTWYARFGKDGSLMTDQVAGLPGGLVAEVAGEGWAAKGDDAFIDDLSIKDVLHRSDGDMLVLLEVVRATNKMVAGSSPIQFTYEWRYGDAIAMRVNTGTGEPVWWTLIPKRQETRASVAQDEFGSFTYHLKGDRLFVLWNNTELSVPSIPPANWTEPDGTRYVKHKAFDPKTAHATFLHVVEPDGRSAYAERKYGLPLFHMHEGAIFEMSMTTPFFFDHHGDLVILAMMHNGGKRYRFGFVGF